MIYTHLLNRGRLGMNSPADSLGERGVGLPDWAAAGTVEAQWALDSGNVPSVHYWLGGNENQEKQWHAQSMGVRLTT